MTHHAPDTEPLPSAATATSLAGGWRQRWPAALRDSWRSLLLPVATVLATILLVLLVPADAVARLGTYGYLGVFVLTLIASASIVLPSPALAAAIIAGQTLNPWFVGLLAGIGAGLGETTGYLAGYTGSRLVVESRWYPRVEGWVRQWGPLTIFVLAAVPSPLIDLAGIAAGTLRMPYRVYLVACVLGKVLRFIGFAWLGRLLV